jgi:hypothetical protein
MKWVGVMFFWGDFASNGVIFKTSFTHARWSHAGKMLGQVHGGKYPLLERCGINDASFGTFGTKNSMEQRLVNKP